MLDPLARFVYRRRRFVAVGAVVFFVVAARVRQPAWRHTWIPYGADDPATDSVKADNLLTDHGYRPTDVIVLVPATRPSPAPQTKSRVEAVERRAPRPRRRRSRLGLLRHALDATSSRTTATRPTSPSHCGPPTTRRRQDAASQHRGPARRQARRHGRRRRAGPGAGQQAGRVRPAHAPSCSPSRSCSCSRCCSSAACVASLLPLLVGGLAIVGTFLILRIASEVGSISIFALNLTTGLGLGLAIDYSLFIVSRYREELAGEASTRLAPVGARSAGRRCARPCGPRAARCCSRRSPSPRRSRR